MIIINFIFLSDVLYFIIYEYYLAVKTTYEFIRMTQQ